VNDYYRGSFVIPQNVLNFVLILPTAYPLEYCFYYSDRLEFALRSGRQRGRKRRNLSRWMFLASWSVVKSFPC
jgi:hypothetical protein